MKIIFSVDLFPEVQEQNAKQGKKVNLGISIGSEVPNASHILIPYRISNSLIFEVLFRQGNTDICVERINELPESSNDGERVKTIVDKLKENEVEIRDDEDIYLVVKDNNNQLQVIHAEAQQFPIVIEPNEKIRPVLKKIMKHYQERHPAPLKQDPHKIPDTSNNKPLIAGGVMGLAIGWFTPLLLLKLSVPLPTTVLSNTAWSLIFSGGLGLLFVLVAIFAMRCFPAFRGKKVQVREQKVLHDEKVSEKEENQVGQKVVPTPGNYSAARAEQEEPPLTPQSDDAAEDDQEGEEQANIGPEGERSPLQEPEPTSETHSV